MSKNHYLTDHIINRVESNCNNECSIGEPQKMFETADDWPKNPNEFKDKLNKMFNDEGYEYAFEVKSCFNDEGGEALSIFLIKPEFKESYNRYVDTHYERNNENWFLLCQMEYVAKNPTHFITVAANPY